MSYFARCDYSENPPSFNCFFRHDNARVTAWESDPSMGKRRHVKYEDGQSLYTYSWTDLFMPNLYTVEGRTQNVVHEKLLVSPADCPKMPLLLGLFTAIEGLGHEVRKGASDDIQSFHIDRALKQIVEITEAVKPLLKPLLKIYTNLYIMPSGHSVGV
jgi:hypothetical protein